MPLYSVTNARGKGPRGVNLLTGGTKLVRVGETVEARLSVDEIEVLRPYFDAQLLSQEGDPIPPEDTRAQRVWLAVADDEHGANMHPLKTGERSFIGFSIGADRPTDPAAYRFTPIPTSEQVQEALGRVERNPLDHDGDGKPGGSEPHEPPALKGLNKKQLLKIAEAEGVEIEDGATNPAITAAIEAKRAAAAAE